MFGRIGGVCRLTSQSKERELQEAWSICVKISASRCEHTRVDGWADCGLVDGNWACIDFADIDILFEEVGYGV